MINPADLDVNEQQMNKYTLKMNDVALEKKYFNSSIKQLIKVFIIFYYASVGAFIAYCIADSVQYYEILIMIGRIVICVCFLIFGLFLFTKKFKNFYKYTIYTVLITVVILKIIFDYSSPTNITKINSN